jgi:hypothetical protein
MSDRARAWLAARAGGVPDALQARMEAAAAAAPPAAALDVARELGDAALACLAAALAGGDDRAAAADLLAADGLITAACEAAVAQGTLDALCASFTPAQLAAFTNLEPPDSHHGSGGGPVAAP